MKAIFVYSAMVYNTFHVNELDIERNRMWVVFRAILDIFIAFMIIAVIAVCIALIFAGGNFSIDLGNLSVSGSGGKKKKKRGNPNPHYGVIP